MANIDYESALFDVLEAITPHFPSIAGGFARHTGGFERDYVLVVIRDSDAFHSRRDPATIPATGHAATEGEGA